MPLRFVVSSAITLFVLAAIHTSACCTVHAAERPNLVVILVDDMGFSDLGCYGGEIETPNIDKLAAGGLRFTQFYNGARCCPTRAALLTGLYAHQAGQGWMTQDLGAPAYQGYLNDRCQTFAEVLRPAGYYTAMAGKWHVGHQQKEWWPRRRGFERFFGSPGGAVYYDHEWGVIEEDEYIYPKGTPAPEGFYGGDAFTDHAIEYIDQSISKEKPFLLYVAHSAPHFPLQAPQELIDKYRGRYMVGWDKLREARYQRQIELGIIDPSWPMAPRPKKVRRWDKVKPEEQDRFDHIMAIYAAAVERMDHNVGRVVNALQERELLDNTVIMFMSDNGGNAETGPRGRLELNEGGERLGGRGSVVFCGRSWATLQNTPFRRYKHFPHEGGISTPLIVHWPSGIKPDRRGSLVKTVGHITDVAPTCYDLAQADYPSEVDGKPITPLAGQSLAPVFRGESFERKKPIFWEHEGNRAVRRGKWKAVSFRSGGPWHLYDMEADRTERRNLASEHPDLVNEFDKLWNDWAAEVGATPFPDHDIWKSNLKAAGVN